MDPSPNLSHKPPPGTARRERRDLLDNLILKLAPNNPTGTVHKNEPLLRISKLF